MVFEPFPNIREIRGHWHGAWQTLYWRSFSKHLNLELMNVDEIWWQEQLSKFIFNIISSVVIMVIFSQYVCLHQKVICSNCNHLEFICGYRWKIYFHGYTWILDTLYTKGNCCLMEALHKFLVSKYVENKSKDFWNKVSLILQDLGDIWWVSFVVQGPMLFQHL